MMHPVGSQPPAVYWRRRLVAVAFAVSVVVLLVLTVQTVLGGEGGEPAAGAAGQHPVGTVTGPATQSSTPPAPAPGTAADTTAGGQHADSFQAAAGTTTPAGRPSKSPSAPACTASQLAVQAVAGKSDYAVGDQPVLTLQVTNTGRAACVQDVADSQIVLRVYNGASRVWGSHDCKIEPGVTDRTLAPDRPAGFSIVWSGLTSQPHCAGTRQRVGAGTYTLYATLSGKRGHAAQFTIS